MKSNLSEDRVMTLIEQLREIILREAPGAHEPDPMATWDDSNLRVHFSLRLEGGEESLVYNIPKGTALAGRRAITRVELAFSRAAGGTTVYVKIRRGK